MWELDDIVRAVKGTVMRAEARSFSGISTDSRTMQDGDLFVPLKGPSFDGHLFISEALKKPGAGALCERGRQETCTAPGTIILVDDGTEALLDLARFRRRQLRGKCLAITGSNGKTTTKELLVRMMEASFSVIFNEKNFNNQIGVSKTICAVTSRPDYLIFELGSNHRGEIRTLAALVEPDASLITNINASHLEGLGDLDGVLAEKVSLFEMTREQGPLFINVDDPCLSPCASAFSTTHTIFTYGLEKGADFVLDLERDAGLSGFDIILSLQGEHVKTTTRLLGRHNLYNILAASALAFTQGVTTKAIGDAVAGFAPYTGRFRNMASSRGFTVIDDTYNANPASMYWALSTLQALPCAGKRIAILGEMKELGEQKDHFHRELGRFLKESALSLILLLGDEMRVVFDEVSNGRAKFFERKGDLIEYALRDTGPEDIVLVKGSRALKMDEIVEALA